VQLDSRHVLAYFGKGVAIRGGKQTWTTDLQGVQEIDHSALRVSSGVIAASSRCPRVNGNRFMLQGIDVL
jgi:hypothetical protein